MRRKIIGLTIVGLCLLGAGILWHSLGNAEGPINGNGQLKPPPSPLPIRHVVLFNSGMGYFQREGEVAGNVRLHLSFPVGDINDLLKSLVLQDLGGGHISTVNYDSQDPMDKILRSFALDLNNNPTFGQILNQARGERIEVLRADKKDAGPAKLAGTIVGMEVQRKQVGKDQIVDVEMLNLVAGGGLQSVPLAEVLAVRFLNPVLESEFQRALQVLASSHDMQKKTVSLGFDGQGKRKVKVGYVVERPIWKTSYRLRLEPNGKVFLQGWALVENTSDDDWNDVHMVLVSGRPISYQMNLYEPLYIPRPKVEPELFASLRPPVYGGSMAGEADKDKMQAKAPPGPGPNFGPFFNLNQIPAQAGMGMMGGQGGFNYIPGLTNSLNNMNVNPYQNNSVMQNQFIMNTQQRLTYEELQNRRQLQQDLQKKARDVGRAVAGLNFKEGIASVASAAELGDYFQYTIDQQITLPRQKSAMLPILDQTIEGSKVSIFNEAVQAKFPLLGLRLKNTSGKPLTQGPITVYEDGVYAGDTRVLDLQPNEERLLSYALDQGTEVKTTVKESPSPEMNFKIGAAQLTARFTLHRTKTYQIKNRSPKTRTLVIEHPVQDSWKLVDPAKPSDRTRDVYRFQVTVAANAVKAFKVTEEQARTDQFALNPGAAPRYAVGLGIEVKPVTATAAPKLVDLKIKKGVLYPKLRVRETKTYFVQNLSGDKRVFTVDHIVRPEWRRLDDDQEQVGPAVFRFQLEVASGKTGSKTVVEEHTRQDTMPSIKDVPEAKLREFLAESAPSADVKAGLTRALTLSTKLTEQKHQLDETTKQLKALSDDQSRLRSNLAIIPQSAEPYKQFLQKFVRQETDIESFQRQIRELQASVQKQQKEYDVFVASLNAD
jgi:hypothetical protein